MIQRINKQTHSENDFLRKFSKELLGRRTPGYALIWIVREETAEETQ